MNANVKRAVSASLDVLRARDRHDADELPGRREFEALTLDALEGDDERFEYAVGVTHAYQQQAARHVE